MNGDMLALLSKDELLDLLLAQEIRHAAEIAALTAPMPSLSGGLA